MPANVAEIRPIDSELGVVKEQLHRLIDRLDRIDRVKGYNFTSEGVMSDGMTMYTESTGEVSITIDGLLSRDG